jgi:hypothetical protein
MTRYALLIIITLSAWTTAPSLGAMQPQRTGTTTADPELIEFEDEIEKYLELRRKLRDEIKSLTVSSDSADIVDASNALAGAIQRARPRAQAGSFFTPATSTIVKHRIIDTVRAEHLGPVLAGIDDDGPITGVVTVYLRFPAAAQMATMPPSLLLVLPRLPKELEYRIVGTALVLRDVDAALVLDYIPAAVPR